MNALVEKRARHAVAGKTQASKASNNSVFEPREEWVRAPFFAVRHVSLFEETNWSDSLTPSVTYALSTVGGPSRTLFDGEVSLALVCLGHSVFLEWV